MVYPAENLHHVMFTARKYETDLEVTFRNMGALVIPVWTQAHMNLHKELKPPPKPYVRQMVELVDILGDVEFENPLRGLYTAINYFSDFKDGRSKELHTNLELQLEFLESGAILQGLKDYVVQHDPFIDGLPVGVGLD